ncbi:hypothetical protein RNJ44_03089 [Nakaseomyces bracarensis]|uniref:Uncharacterized protein n=1 Tax=Nakaseomyces bracarensis TaxID=273131 RepID=A0ABR4NYT4_9SACH
MTEEERIPEESDSEWVYCDRGGNSTDLYERVIIRHVLFPPIEENQFREGSDEFIPWEHDGIRYQQPNELSILVEVT